MAIARDRRMPKRRHHYDPRYSKPVERTPRHYESRNNPAVPEELVDERDRHQAELLSCVDPNVWVLGDPPMSRSALAEKRAQRR